MEIDFGFDWQEFKLNFVWFRHRMQDGQYEVQKWMPNDWNGLLGNWTPCKRPKGTPEL